MEGIISSSSSSPRVAGHGQEQVVAPFVSKAYQMVNDPRTDGLIRWGKGNNSFLVVNPNEFSQFLLPFYFKHSNFSSFVRQLNTYGFKKVDPDKWEFAHQSFLRGQIHLLPYVVRRTRKSHVGFAAATSSGSSGIRREEDEEEEEEEKKKEEEAAEASSEVEEMVLREELYRLRQEQRALDRELQAMSKRLQATETKPHQMMSFLVKMAADPELLSGVAVSKKQQFASAAKKRRALVIPPQQLPPPPPLHPYGNQIINNGIFLPPILVTGIEETLARCEEVKPFTDLRSSALAQEQSIVTSPNSGEFEMNTTSSDSPAAAAAAPFPFSLLGNGFYY